MGAGPSTSLSLTSSCTCSLSLLFPLQNPIHVMIGGGDQLYNDAVWEVPALVEWLRVGEKTTQLAHPFTQDMVNQVRASRHPSRNSKALRHKRPSPLTSNIVYMFWHPNLDKTFCQDQTKP